MANAKFERFGKYLILDHLVDGGMAKICRARFLGEQANKVVAIKMVQQQYSKDPSFVQMFEDELKVTFGLLHPNIAQMYDYGMVDGQLYTAMEYVDGANIKQYIDRLKEKNFVFPVEISTYIISQVCQALHYAHTFTDKLTGTPFNIIHRDISPHNIMLTYDGAVKVIDFGIAKADSNSEATQAGTIKGKLSYLAPEYLDGLALDHRYDQFAVGITLWELLCSRKLFQAANDLAVLKQIQNCKIPAPSSINPNVPKELDQIVLKSLAKDRSQRYENMDKFNRALVKFLYSNYPDFNATDLGYFAKQLFKEEITKDKDKFVEYGKIDIKPYIEDLERDGVKSERPASKPVVSSDSESTRKIEIDFGLDKEGTKAAAEGKLELAESRTSTGIRKPKKAVRPKSASSEKSSKMKVAANIAPAAVAGGGTRASYRVKRRKGDTSSKTGVRSGTGIRAKNAQSSSSGGVVGFVACLALALFVYTQSDFVSRVTGYDVSALLGKDSYVPVGEGNRDIANKEDNRREKMNDGFGYINFGNLDSKMKIFVNGNKVETLGIKAKVPLNQLLSISVLKPGYKKYVFEDNLKLNSKKSEIDLTIPDLEKESVGLLSTSSNFTTGSKLIIEVAGEKIEKELPFSNLRVPAGQYEGIIANPLLGTERKVIFEVKENKRLFLE